MHVCSLFVLLCVPKLAGALSHVGGARMQAQAKGPEVAKSLLHIRQLPETGPEDAPLRSVENAGSGYVPEKVPEGVPDREEATTMGQEEAEKFIPTQEGIPSSPEAAGEKLDSIKPPGSFKEVGRNIEESWWLVVNALISSLVSLLTILLCAVVYRYVKKDPVMPQDERARRRLDAGEWRFGLFDCHQTPALCLLAWCCPFIRWSDTMRMANLMGFWLALVVSACLGTLIAPTASLTFWIWVCLAAYKRQQIRQLFGIQPGTSSTYCQDCITFWCCGCCAITQEARQLEEAWTVGHDVVKVEAPAAPRTVVQRLY